MFELLFNYPLIVWREATLVFDTSWPLWLLVALGLLMAFVILASVWCRSLGAGRKITVWVLQSVAASVVLFMLWQPSLLVAISERGENTVAWIVDNSNSMLLADVVIDDQGDSSLTRFVAAGNAVEKMTKNEASEFSADLYTLGKELKNIDSLVELRSAPMSAKTNLADGLTVLLNTVNDTALAAVVLLSDGADNAQQLDSDWWRNLQAAGVPVHTVGTGGGLHPNDLELADVTVPDVAQPDTLINARLRIRHLKAGAARVRITAGKELLAAVDVQLPADVTQSIHTVPFPSGDSGIRQLEFSIEAVESDNSELSPDSTDPIPDNNRQPRILQVMDSPKRVLYVEGEPRWEYKFLRRAIDSEPSIKLVSLLRTSPNKFYRQGVESPKELANGFPVTREALFRYDAIIMGSIDAVELSTEQQVALRDFVSVRGGSLLMLGGRHGLADGGWGRSVTAAALPVVLNSQLNSKTFNRARSQAMPTLAGLRTPWLSLSDDQRTNIRAWQELPALADAQSVGQPKPGAITLLEQVSLGSQLSAPEALLVMQRYGKGKSAVLGSSGTWRWQMSLPSEDDRHERFWSQFLWALVESSTPPLKLSIEYPVVRDTETTSVVLHAYNPDFSPVQESTYPVRLTSSDGVLSSVQLYADAENPGRFSGMVPVEGDGAFSVSATSPLDGESPTKQPFSIEQWWVGESDNAESYDSQLNTDFLQRVAEVSGGSYLALADVEQLKSVLAIENAALKRESRLPLWNMPFLFLCLILLKGTEWLLRLQWKRL
jgi:hypothetical protein